VLYKPVFGNFNYVTGNALTTRPAAAFGTSITPGFNAYPSYASILAGGSITEDCYWIVINVNSLAATTLAKDALCKIGIDTSGGTSYVDLIPDLLCSGASTYLELGRGVWYHFPLFIRAGSQLAAAISVNNATVGTARVAVWLLGRPRHSHDFRYGYSIEAIGVTPSSSSGTPVTSGTTSEGAWTSLGTTVQRCFFWQVGRGCNDATSAAVYYDVDLAWGDASNKYEIGGAAAHVSSGNAEQHSLIQYPKFANIPAGSTIYGRMQCSGTPDSSNSMAAYGVVG
jgi:hypothetical protein